MTAEPWMPPSGFVELDGYVWLPRLLAKARRQRERPLEGYLAFDASPLDGFALSTWRVKGDDIRGWLEEGLSDEAIARKIAAAAGHDNLGKRQSWSRGYRMRYGVFVHGIDADEGRMAPGLIATLLKLQLELVFVVVKQRNRLFGLK